MESILKYGLTEGFNYLRKGGTAATQKQVLDPLTTVLRLATLKYKPVGTKIGIHNNSVWVQSPTLLQGTIRWSYGDGRDDLHNLYEPIYAVTRWYSTENSKPVRRIFMAAIEGLTKLRKVYSKISDSNLVSHSISHYITLLEGALTGPDQIEIQEIAAPWDEMWKEDEIAVVDRMFQIAERHEEDGTHDHYVAAVENVLNAKDIETRSLTHRLFRTLNPATGAQIARSAPS